MKKLILPMAAVALFGACSTESKEMRISGSLTGIEGDKVLMKTTNLNGTINRIDTVAVVDGKIDVVLPDSTLSIVSFVGIGEAAPQGATNSVFITPGSQLTINGDLYDYTVEGNAFYTALKAQDKITAAREDADEFFAGMVELYRKGQLTDSINAIFEGKQEQVIGMMSEYIQENPNSDLSAYYLLYMPLSEVGNTIDKIADNVKNGGYGEFVAQRASEYASYKAQEEAKAKLQPGKPAPNFSLKDIDGNTVTLDQFRGKYVVLDFWGTWCSWCIKGIPEMKTYYDKYKDQMEIIGIACRDTEQAWRAGVAKYELPWVNVFNGNDKAIIEEYAVSGFPTKAIIDPQGNIVTIIAGESPEFYTILDEKLGK